MTKLISLLSEMMNTFMGLFRKPAPVRIRIDDRYRRR